MNILKHLYRNSLFWLCLFLGTIALDARGAELIPNKQGLIEEGQRQFQTLLKQNEQNRVDGCTEDNVYVFSFLSNDDWSTYIKTNQQAPEFAYSYITELNNRLKQFNENPALSDYGIYVCLVSELEVRVAFDYSAFQVTAIPDIIDKYREFGDVTKDATAGQSADNIEALEAEYDALIAKIYKGVDVDLQADQNYSSYKSRTNRTLLTNTAVKVIVSDPVFGDRIEHQRRIYGGTTKGYFSDHIEDILAYEKRLHPQRGSIVFRNRVLSFLEYAEGQMDDPTKKRVTTWDDQHTILGNAVIGGQNNVDYTNAEMSQPQTYLFDYTGVYGTKAQAANDQINQLLSGTKSKTNTKVRVFVTDEQVAQSRIDAIKDLDLTDSYFDNSLVLWIHIQDNGDVQSTIRLSDDLDAELQNAISNNRFDEWVEFGLNHSGSSIGKEILDFLITAVYKTSNFLVETIRLAEIPEKYYRADSTAIYDPFLKNVMSFVNPTLLLSDVIMQPLFDAYPNLSSQGTASDVQFALFCGLWNGVIDELVGTFELISMVGYWVDDGNEKKQEVEALIKLFEEGKVIDSIKDGLVKSHTGPPCKVAHTIGKDIIAVVTLVIPYTKASALSKVRKVVNVLDALNPITHVFNAAGFVMKKAAGKVVDIVIPGLNGLNDIKIAFVEDDWLIAIEDELYGGAIPFVGAVDDIPYENLAVQVVDNSGQKKIIPSAIAMFHVNPTSKRLGRMADAATSLVDDLKNLFSLEELFESATKADIVAGKVSRLADADQLMLNGAVFSRINDLPDALKKEFFVDLAQSGMKDEAAFIGNNIAQFTEEMIDAWEVLQTISSQVGVVWKRDFPTLNKLEADLAVNSNLADYLKNNFNKFDTWNNITSEFSYLRNSVEYIEALFEFRKPFLGDLIASPHWMRRHVLFGDIEIHVYKNGQPHKKYFFPATKFLDTTPGSGGLVDKLAEIRNFLNDPSGLYTMKPAAGSKMTGVKGLKGFHAQYTGCTNCANPLDGTLNAANGQPITKGTVLGVLSDGAEIFEINYPSVKAPTADGWNYIKTSGGASPQQVIEDILNDSNKWGWQQKTNSSISTFYPQNISLAQYEEIIAAAIKDINLSSGTSAIVPVAYKGKNLDVKVMYGSTGFHSAYITGVNP